VKFVICDVFTEKAFGGNQLAVFPDARGLGDGAMQALAREFNFAETTFVLPPQDPGHFRRVRIFTPKVELPFAGHPTVGTAAVLPGTVASRYIEPKGFSGGVLSIEHPSGHIEVDLVTTRSGAAPVVERASFVRTARRIFDGHVYVPDALFD